MKTKYTLTMTLLLMSASVMSQSTTSYGANAGTQGTDNTFIGYYSGNSSATGGNSNTFVGSRSGESNTSGDYNTFVGHGAGNSVVAATHNTFFGYFSGYNSTNGSLNIGDNSFFGSNSGRSNTTGTRNSFFGTDAGYKSVTGLNSTFVGYRSGFENTTGTENSFFGYASGYLNTTGSYNTNIGLYAGRANTSGNNNTTLGYHSGYNSTSSNNVYIGYQSGYSNTSGTGNTFQGYQSGYSNTTGNYNTALGYGTDLTASTYSNTTAIGYNTVVTASNQIRLGNASVTSIGGQVGWTILSDGRFKTDVKQNVPGLDFITKLNPVSYFVDASKFNHFIGLDTEVLGADEAELRAKPQRRIGLVAQEVEATIEKEGYELDIVDAPKNDQDYYGIRYDELVVPLIKSVQELSQQMNDQLKEIETLKGIVAEQKELIDAFLFSSGNYESDLNQTEGSSLIFQNQPNPFGGETEIRVNLGGHSYGNVEVVVYDLKGNVVKSFNINTQGDSLIKITSDDMNPGMYLYTLVADSKVLASRKMILTR